MHEWRNCQRFVVVTGGPRSGKTPLIEALAAAGHARTFEAGRAIIQDQRRIDFSEAVRTYEALVRTYRDCDYELILLPLDSPQVRVKFVLENVSAQL